MSVPSASRQGVASPAAEADGLLARACEELADGRIEEARRLCRDVLQADAGHVLARRCLARVDLADGDLDRALATLRAIADDGAAEAEDFCALARALWSGGAETEAIDAFREAIALNPSHVEARHGLALRLIGAGDAAGAEMHLRAALAIAPERAPLHKDLGLALSRLGRDAEARECFSRALAIVPDYPEAHFELGTALAREGSRDAAIRCLRHAIAARPEFAEAHRHLGRILLELGRPAEAAESLTTTLHLMPGFPGAALDLGVALTALDRYEQAETSLRHGIDEQPDAPEGWVALGEVHWRLHQYDAAATDFRQAIGLRPDHAMAHVQLGKLCLSRGDYLRGWQEYEWRQRTPCSTGSEQVEQPLWLGDKTLTGRTILLHAEPDWGDTIQFSRYVPLVAAAGRVLLRVPRALLKVMKGLPGVAHLVAEDDRVPAFDLHCPLPSLPLAFRTKMGTIPPPVPPLPGEATPRGRDGERLRIGLAWSGDDTADPRRSMTLPLLSGLVALPGLRVSILQTRRSARDLSWLARQGNVEALPAEDADLATLAETIAGLDVIVTVDCVVAHLAGALGRPVWIMLPHTCDWRWGNSWPGTPWYPSARLFRQATPGDWTPMLEKIAYQLRTLAATTPHAVA